MAIVLVGGISSGKTSTQNELLLKFGYRKIVTYTTRPQRDGEVNGSDYHFLSDAEFLELKDAGYFAETSAYNTVHGIWWYGSAVASYSDVSEKDVIILDPVGVAALGSLRKKCFVVLLECSFKDALVRGLSRGDNINEVLRRIVTDDAKFMNFKDYDLKISTDRASFNSEDVARLIVYRLASQDKPTL